MRPFWSPDSRHVAFIGQGKLKRVPVSGGPAQVICDAPSGADGALLRGLAPGEGSVDFALDMASVGDVDGDGVAEIFTTPSKPNKLDGTIQPGEIDMWDLDGGEWVRREVDILETRHAKEILFEEVGGI